MPVGRRLSNNRLSLSMEDSQSGEAWLGALGALGALEETSGQQNSANTTEGA